MTPIEDYMLRMKDEIGGPEHYKETRNFINDDYRANQERMRQWAAPVKQQNKQMKNQYLDKIGLRYEEMPDSVRNQGREAFNTGRIFGGSASARNEQYNERVPPQRPTRTRNYDGGYPAFEKLTTPLRALPMVAPEALGMYGAAQEAQRQGVNPMVNWMQRMTPVPIVQPTGNGGEVYNYQSGERYTPMF